jgi:hypothetical protein
VRTALSIGEGTGMKRTALDLYIEMMERNDHVQVFDERLAREIAATVGFCQVLEVTSGRWLVQKDKDYWD